MCEVSSWASLMKRNPKSHRENLIRVHLNFKSLGEAESLLFQECFVSQQLVSERASSSPP
jgi:hypothetical protein